MTKQNKVFLTVNAVMLALVLAGGVCYITLGGVLVKGLASGAFVLCGLFNLIYAIVTKQKGYAAYKYLLVFGLVLAAAGDVALNFHFLTGMILFALGHVLFLSAFFTLKPLGWKDILPCAGLVAFTLCMLLLYPKYDFGSLLIPVLVYGVVLSLMLGKAIGILLETRIKLRVCGVIAAGAILFFLSDLFLTLNLFAGGGKVYDLFCLGTYYPAEFLLAISVGLTAMSGDKCERVQMNLVRRLYCRAFQGVFCLALPVLPYRRPRLLNSCAETAALLKEKNKTHAFLVTDKGVRSHGLTKPVEDALASAGISCTVFDETAVNPTVENAETALFRYRQAGCDCVIAIGGGSAMDCAKAVCARLTRPKKTLAELRGILKVFGKTPLFIAVPTTAGTGSEATIAAVVTDEKTHDKFTVISFCLAPKYAVLDPEMTRTLPPAPTAETGMDALTHAVEAYIGNSTTRETRRLAVHAVALVKENLLAAYRDGNNLEARRNMQLAAYEAGYAFSKSYVGYVHALAHSLGGKYNYPHGRTNATLLPRVLKVYGDSCARKLARLAIKSGIAEKGDAGAAEKFIAFIEYLNRETNIPDKLKVEEKDIPELARHADKEANPLYPVPRLMNAKALEEIYRSARELPQETPAEKLARQKEYFASGATLCVKERVRHLRKLYAAIKAHEAEICEALKTDLGKSNFESFMCEIGMTYGELTYMIKHAKRLARDKRVRTPMAQYISKSYKKRSPYGCTLIMSPWNYPFMLTLEPLADAVAAGNCVVVKPSAYSSATSEVIKKLLEEVFPPERVAVVTGGRKENDILLDLPFDKIFFTGSVNVGKEVMRRAADKLIPVTLELGGKSPCIVDETANLKLAARRIVFGKFLNCGQTCVAPDYVLVHSSVKDKLLGEIKKQIVKQFGDNPLENPAYGKIINEKHYTRICGLIDKEKLAFGGETDESALKIAPTVLTGVTREHAVMQEEIFGPVLPVLTFESREELISELQALPSPLALYLFTSDKKAVKEITSRCQFGGGCVNDTIIHLATSNMGFGGVAGSGMGSYHGKDGFFCFTHEKSIVNKKTWLDLPMRYQPYKKILEKITRLFLR